MALLGTRKKTINGAERQIALHCDSDGDFFITLPDFMKEACLGEEELNGRARVEAKTAAECWKLFDNMVAKFEASKTATRKVIVYEIEIHAGIVRNGIVVLSTQPEADNRRFSNDHKEISLYVAASVAIEKSREYSLDQDRSKTGCGWRRKRELNKLKLGRVDYEFLPSSIPGHEHHLERHIFEEDNRVVIDWTPQREEFFARLVTSMEELILMVDKFRKAESLLPLIDSGKFQMALPAPAPAPPKKTSRKVPK